MQIAINEKNEITGYATFGKLQNGIECFVEIPSDFAPKKYKLITDEPEDGTTYSVEPNPGFAEDRTPEVTAEQRMSAVEDAVAELIEMMLGGDE